MTQGEKRRFVGSVNMFISFKRILIGTGIKTTESLLYLYLTVHINHVRYNLWNQMKMEELFLYIAYIL